MPASLTELKDIFQRLSDALEDAKLEWLLNQITEHILQGKAATTRVKELQEQQFSDSHLSRKLDELFTPGPFREYPTTVEYSPHERIAVLLSAVEQLVLRVPEMEDAVAHHFPGARFVGEAEAVVVQSRSASQSASANKFKELIDAIRREVGISVH